ncbi:hypothetical protein [Nocardioides houyundeii]|uniref:hypothetical protein n=1 Tax=Nocardioides houyundeii TaxID=2045452 RepID=UPI0013159D1D|nr:hypothetical protein [Nocardioides houyundeii]
MMIRPPHSVLLVVGREDFAPPTTFGGATCVATPDCVAVAVIDVTQSPTRIALSPSPGHDLRKLGEFWIESEGLVSIRDIFGREHDTMGVPPGLTLVTIWGDRDDAPRDVAVQITR